MQRRHPPPDLDMIEDGWVLTEKEAAEKMIKKRLINRMSKKIVVPPQVQGEKEYMQRCKKIALEMLLGVRNLIYCYKFIKIDLPVPCLFKKRDSAIRWSNHQRNQLCYPLGRDLLSG